MAGIMDTVREYLAQLDRRGRMPDVLGLSRTNVPTQSQQVAAAGADLPVAPVDENSTGLPPSVEALIRRMRESTQAAIAPRSPVITPGASSVPTPAPNTQAGDAAAAAAPATSDTSTQTSEPSSDDDTNRRLRDFGFGMAASRNPSLFGQIGEAGLNMQRGNRDDRQDTNREREVAATEEYRRAQVQLARAEQEWARDPNNPANVARLAHAQAYMAQATRARSGGGGSGSEGSFVPLQREDGSIAFFSPRSGRIASPGEGYMPVGASANTPDQRALEGWNRARREFQERILLDPMARIQAPDLLRTWESQNPRPRLRGEPTTGGDVAAPPAQDRVRIQMNPTR